MVSVHSRIISSHSRKRRWLVFCL
uniref:Uncharacterized protein n=1 Tax=Anguilla anguilla TaxID=7936 RepID=A0A0E9UD84_ANGAN